MLRRVSIKVRLILTIAFGLVFAVAIAAAFTENTLKIQKFSVDEAQKLMLQGQRLKLEVATQAAASILGQTIKGVENKDERLALIRNAVETFRFEDDKSGYFFVYEGTVNVALPPKKEIQGKDLGETKDKNGVRFVSELAKAAAEGGGFVEYVFPKPGAGEQPKLSYATLIPGTDLWIGTGVYIDNVEAARNRIDGNITGMVNSSIYWISGVMAAVIILLVLPLAVLFTRSVTGPISAATAAAQRISHGDYDVRLDESGRDEASIFMRSLNEMAATLRENILQITAKTREAEAQAASAKKAAEEAEQAQRLAEHAKSEGMMVAAEKLEDVVTGVAALAAEITAHTSEISQGAQIQGERIQSTAAAMEEMNATVLEVARNASAAAERGEQVRQIAKDGAAVVLQSIEAMNATHGQAKTLQESMNALGLQVESIGQVMNVISDIADQTNLLALNAAIEAARAGEAGRGFAVVADEVRKLAEKTMSATKQVGDSIRAIQDVTTTNITAMDKAVDDLQLATEYSNKSGEMLSRIVEGVEDSAEQIRSIATAAEEQSASSEEINHSIEEINKITRETVEGVSQSATAAHELSEQLTNLNSLTRELKAG